MKIAESGWELIILIGLVFFFLLPSEAKSQANRADSIAIQQEEKAKRLQPEQPDKAEQFIKRMQDSGWFFSANPRGLYPYIGSVYPGGGLALGAGYRTYYGDYSFAEIRGLYSLKNYKSMEFRTVSANHAGGILDLELNAKWMDATQTPYYGLGINSNREDKSNYRIQESGIRGGFTLKPAAWFHLKAGTGYDRFLESTGKGTFPSVGEIHGSDTAPGLGASPSYIHSEASASIVWAPAEGYARRGGVYRYSFHDYRSIKGNLDDFKLTRGEVVQHIPILRETWVLSLRGRIESVMNRNAVVPYYLLPWLGSGTTLRGFGTGRFRDRHSLLMTGEWRWIPNRFFLDMALFYDVGTVAPRFKDIRFDHLKHDYGIGVRIHGPAVTALRFDVARGSEGWAYIFAASAPF